MEMENTKCDNFWGDPPGTSNSSHGHGSHSHSQHLQYERNLNFSTVTIEDNEYGFPRKKTVRDPMSHRIIEKRRRDRMNNCLADLARLLPPDSLRKGRGRIEKTEIVELAIKHLRHLQTHPCPDSDNCEYNQIPLPRASSSSHGKSTVSNGGSGSSSSSSNSSGSGSGEVGGSGSAALGGVGGEGGSGKSSDHSSSSAKINPEEQYRLGYQESVSETMHFLVEHEGMYAGDDLCVRLVQHLNGHCEALLMDHVGNNTKIALGFPMNSRSPVFKGRKSGGSLDSISSGYLPNGSSGSGSDGNCVNDGDRDGINNTPFGSKNAFSRQPGQSLTSQSLRVSNSSSGGDRDTNSLFVDYEGDQNSCSSAPLSIEISDAYSQDIDGKMTGRSQGKPPVPTIICSHSSSNNSGSPPVSNSDEGNSMTTNSSTSTNTAHRYKFKNNIKQRFSADLQTEIIVHSHNNRTTDGSVTSGSGRDSSQESRHRNPQKSCLNSPRDSSRENESPDYFPKSPDSEKNPTSASGSSHEHSKERNQNQPEETEQSQASQSNGQTLISQDANPTSGIAATKVNAPLLTHEEERTEFEIPSIPSPSLEVDKKPIVGDLLPAHVTLPIITTVASSLKGEGDGKPTTVTCGPQGVPAFALHDKGLYYIPLTIDKSIVSPFIDAMDGNSTPPLHPVTISVCFVLPPDDGPSGHKKYEAHESSNNLSSLSIPIPLPLPHSPPVFGALHHPPSGKIHREFSSSPSNFIMNRFTQSQGPNMIFRSPTSGGGASVVKSNNGGSFRGHGGYPISGGSECSSQSSSNHGQSHHHQHLHHSDPTAVHNLYHHGGRNGDGGGSRSGNVEFHSSNYYTNSNSGSNAHRSSGSSSSMSVSSSSMSVSHHGTGTSSESSSASGSASASRSRLSRKRSISKSPSISIGYHSWSDKTGGSNETCSTYSTDEGVITGHRSRGDHSGDRDVASTSSASPCHSGPVPMGFGQLTPRGIPMPVPMTMPIPVEPHSHGHGHGHGDALHSLPVRHHSNMNSAPNSMKSVAASAQIQIPVLFPDHHHHHPQQQHQHHQSLTTSSLMEHEERQHQQQLLTPVSSRRESKSRVDSFPPSSTSAKRSKKSRMDEGIAGVTHKISNGGYASSRKHVSSN